MSEFKIRKLTDRAGTGAPNFTYGFNINGSDSGLLAPTHTEGSTEPSSPSNGDTWWDTGNDKYYVYVDSVWRDLTLAATAATYTGSRGFSILGDLNQRTAGNNDIQYFDMTTSGNASNFGNILGSDSTTNKPASCGGNGTRALIQEGTTNINTTQVCYITCATTGNASDFGDTLYPTYSQVALSNGVYFVLAGGYGDRTGGSNTQLDNFEYFTIETTGNATLGSGTLTYQYAASGDKSGICGSTYGMIAGGQIGSSFTDSDAIMRMTIATTTTASDFGDLTGTRRYHAGGFNATRAIWGGGASINGGASGQTNVIEYVTIDTPGNGADFGDLVSSLSFICSCSDVDNNRTAFIGGNNGSARVNTIQYVDVSTAGNATDAGDLVYAISGGAIAGASGAAS